MGKHFQPNPDLISAANKRRVRHPESELQRNCFKLFRYQYPQFRMLYFSIPNEGVRSKGTAGIMKSQGLTSGVFDTFLAVPKYYPSNLEEVSFHGLFIEFKHGKNKLTDNQIEFQKAAREQGYQTAVVYTLDEFIKTINQYLNT